MSSPLLPVLNTVLAPTMRGRYGPRHPEAAVERILTRAAKAAGTARPSLDDPVISDFAFLVAQFAAAEGLSPVGWSSVTVDLQNRIANYLRVQRLHAQHPEIGLEDVSDPVIVVGLPRTATTLVHNLIAAAEGHRGTALWELLHTDLPLDEAEQARIIAGVERGQQIVRLLAPRMRDIHPQAALKADEDAFLTIHGPQHQARALMPDYQAWEIARDARGDYVYLKQALQVLQHERERRRWVLKNPIHLAHLPELLGSFPKATIVWMHRDPITIIGSICSLVETSHQLHLRSVDPEAIGRMCLDMLRRLVEAGRRARTGIAPGRLVDVPYDRLTGLPHESVPELYDLLDIDWTDRDAAGLDAILARPARARTHEYLASRYGIDEVAVDAAFGDYGNLARATALQRR